MTSAQTYTAAVYGSAMMVMGQMENGFTQKFAAVGFLAAVGVVMRVEGWVSEMMLKIAENKMEKRNVQDRVACGLYNLGFCRLHVLIEMDRKFSA